LFILSLLFIHHLFIYCRSFIVHSLFVCLFIIRLFVHFCLFAHCLVVHCMLVHNSFIVCSFIAHSFIICSFIVCSFIVVHSIFVHRSFTFVHCLFVCLFVHRCLFVHCLVVHHLFIVNLFVVLSSTIHSLFVNLLFVVCSSFIHRSSAPSLPGMHPIAKLVVVSKNEGIKKDQYLHWWARWGLYNERFEGRERGRQGRGGPRIGAMQWDQWPLLILIFILAKMRIFDLLSVYIGGRALAKNQATLKHHKWHFWCFNVAQTCESRVTKLSLGFTNYGMIVIRHWGGGVRNLQCKILGARSDHITTRNFDLWERVLPLEFSERKKRGGKDPLDTLT
jgi:hypothetical protein